MCDATFLIHWTGRPELRTHLAAPLQLNFRIEHLPIKELHKHGNRRSAHHPLGLGSRSHHRYPGQRQPARRCAGRAGEGAGLALGRERPADLRPEFGARRKYRGQTGAGRPRGIPAARGAGPRSGGGQTLRYDFGACHAVCPYCGAGPGGLRRVATGVTGLRRPVEPARPSRGTALGLNRSIRHALAGAPRATAAW